MTPEQIQERRKAASDGKTGGNASSSQGRGQGSSTVDNDNYDDVELVPRQSVYLDYDDYGVEENDRIIHVKDKTNEAVYTKNPHQLQKNSGNDENDCLCIYFHA